MARTSHPSFLEATQRFVDAALKSDNSIFTPDTAIWTAAAIDDFYERFVVQADEGGGSFSEKLASQLADADSATVQLAGELLWVHLLAPMNVSGERKREHLMAALGLAEHPVAPPEHDLDVLDLGMANVGMGMQAHRFFMIGFLVAFVRDWKSLPVQTRESLLEDPWAFKRYLFELPCVKGGSQREALLHFVHPDSFESIVSKKHKARIVEVFGDIAGEELEDRDQQIFAIRQQLTDRFGRNFSFYEPDIATIWLPSPGWDQFLAWGKRFYACPEFDAKERGYKLEFAGKLLEVRDAVADGESGWPDSLHSVLGLDGMTYWRANDRLRDWCKAEPDTAREALLRLWDSDGPSPVRFLEFLTTWGDEKPGSRRRVAAALMMAVDPTSHTPYPSRTFSKAFRLTGYSKPATDATDADVYAHAMGFLDRIREEARERDLELRDRLDAQGLLWSIVNWNEFEPPVSEWPDEERAALGAFRGEDYVGGVDDEEEDADDQSKPVDPLQELADELLVERSFFSSAVQLLRDKGQVIFYGPPGTGKTYVARKLALNLAKDPRRVTLVQFHPTYAYEDFVQGFRPSESGGASGFALQDGPLLRFARAASEDPTNKYVLVVDEINRGNVAKVFGELYFLLEYRSEGIELQYSQDEFALPPNLWIIGTMNTADRSIALIDAALRRRFYFLPFFPDRRPIEGLLGRWLARHKPGMTWVADALDKANRELDDPNIAIGPSYFMKKNLNEQWVETIWRHAVIPYLQEHFFEAEEQLSRFELAALRGIKQTVDEDESGQDEHAS